MSKAQLAEYLQNPNVQAFLATLRDAEGTNQTGNPYQTRFGGKVDETLDLSKYPTFEYKQFTQTDGKKNVSGAVGAYQFITKTWKNLANQYGFKDFSPETQDMAAVALLQQNGALPHILKGDFATAVKKSNRTWASLPGSPYAQHTRSDDFIAKSLAKNMGQPLQEREVETASAEEVASFTPTPPTQEDPVQQPEPFKPTAIAELSDGTEVIPQSPREEQFLVDVANSDRTPEEKDRIARMGAMFAPTAYDVNFITQSRASLPTELDDQIRNLIREV